PSSSTFLPFTYSYLSLIFTSSNSCNNSLLHSSPTRRSSDLEQHSRQDRRGPEHELAPEPFDDESGDDHAEDADSGHRAGHEEGRLVLQPLLLEDPRQPCQCRIVDKQYGHEERP